MQSPKVPSGDGELNEYNLTQSTQVLPRIYYVNGIRVLGRDHALTAALLSLITERPVWGVYNKTSGLVSGLVYDFKQCLMDYAQNVSARTVGANRKLVPDQRVPKHRIPAVAEEVIRNSVVWNVATVTLFRQLMLNSGNPQMIIAHSQGNLITSNALFVLEQTLGSQALRNIRVYSLASPAPAWPLGLSIKEGGGGRQENAFMNDLVALLRPHNLAAKVGVGRYQNEGDFRTDKDSWAVSIGPHDTNKNIALNFMQSIRNDLGMTHPIPEGFLQKHVEATKDLFPNNRGWLQWLDDMF